MYLATKSSFGGHVSNDLYREFESVLFSSDWKAVRQPSRVEKALFRHTGFRLRRRQIKRLGREDTTLVIGFDLATISSSFSGNASRKAIWMYDAWPNLYKTIVDAVKQFNIDYLFVSSSQAAEDLKAVLPGSCQCCWIPEAINSLEYLHLDPAQKYIDVISLGRRWELHHKKIARISEKYTYIYQDKKNVIYPRRQDFIRALGAAKISICVPSAITHPERSGHVETMTSRYLQSIASKCLILGIAPREMLELFSYNPVVSIDIENAEDQVKDILKNITAYQDLIERNYEEVLRKHQWFNRRNTLESILKNKISKASN